MKSIIVLAVSALFSLSTLAETGPYAEKRQELLERAKAAESASHQARIAILHEADACIKAARTPADYRACEQQEQAARTASRAAGQGERQAIRAEAQQLRQELAQRREERRRGSD